MIYDIKSMLINGTPISFQNGYVFRATEHVLYWMGTPPSEDDLKSRERMRINWNRVLIPAFVQNKELTQGFNFKILTTEGHSFSGNAFFVEELLEVGRYKTTEAHPIVVEFKEELVIDPLLFSLLKNSRPMTEEERKIHQEGINKLFKPTGRNLFDTAREEGTAQEGVSGKEENNG